MSRKKQQNFYYKSNRLQQLRGFHYAMRMKNISKAAKYLGLTHATVSVQIKSLEQDLGVTLFERHGPRIEPTDAAQMLYEVSSPHIEGIDSIIDLFNEEKERQDTHRLHIGGTNSVLNFVFPKLLKRYVKIYPHTDVSVEFMEHHRGLQAVMDGAVDALMFPRRQHLPFGPDFDYMPLLHFPPVLISLPNHPLAGKPNLTVQEIARYDFTLPDKEMYVIPGLYDVFKTYQIDKKFRINLVNWEVTKKFIEAGLAISITSDIVMEKNDKLVATPLDHLFPRVDYGFVFRKGRPIPWKVQPLIDIAKSFHGKLPLE